MMRHLPLVAMISTLTLAIAGCPILPPPQPELLAPAPGEIVAASEAELAARLPNSDDAAREVVFYGRQISPPGEDFTFVLLPDTQKYAEGYPDTFLAQTQWIVQQRDTLNIAAVFHLGDLVESAGDTTQWEVADAAFDILDGAGGPPYGIVVGNHDQSPSGDPAGTENFNRYFPASRYEGVVPWYGGHFGDNNDNHYILFTASGLDFVAICLEFDREANPSVLAWANDILAQYSDRRGIVVTHFNMVGVALDNRFSQQGQAIYDALKSNPNLFLILGGHFCEVGRRTDRFGGNVVYSLLADYQCRPNGGDGWLRLLEFSPANNSIRVRTYSPTRHEFLTEARQQFTLRYVMSGDQPFVEIGRLTLAAGQRDAHVVWRTLESNTRCEWRVSVTNGNWTDDGPVWSFEVD